MFSSASSVIRWHFVFKLDKITHREIMIVLYMISQHDWIECFVFQCRVLCANGIHFMQNEQKCNILLWRHNGRESVSNQQPHDYLLNRLFRRRSKKTSKLRVTAFVRGIHRGPVNSPHKWPVTREMFPFGYVIMTYRMRHRHQDQHC